MRLLVDGSLFNYKSVVSMMKAVLLIFERINRLINQNNSCSDSKTFLFPD